MTKKELHKLIEDAVAEAISEPMREPEVYRAPKPVYRPVLKTELEIDDALFYGGNRPKEEEK